MSARSHNDSAVDAAALQLAPALRHCLSSAVIVVSRNEQITAASPESASLFDLSADKLDRAPLSVLPVAIQNIVRESFATRRPVVREDVQCAAPVGVRSFRVSVTPVPSSQDSLDAVVVINDVAALDSINDKLLRLDRLSTVGTLSATMAHEIKNALVAVKTFVDLLLEKNRDTELSEVVSHEMKRMESIVRQMLKFGGPARPNFSTVKLHDVLDQSLRMVQHKLDGKLISLNRSFKASADAIHGDDYQLEQAFVNLFLNAAEATGTNGTLTVATEFIPPAAKSQAHLCVTVADTGAGIAPEHLEKLFEPFFTTKHHGTGLGLPITQRIIQEHNGEITVQSQPSKGTTFLIKIPVAARA